MRKQLLVLASVATMALAGTTAPAFAADDQVAATPPAAATVTCTIQPAITNPVTGQTIATISFKVSAQAAAALTAHPITYTNPFTGVTYTVTCK
jgi:hypothetical protein